ncbi:Dna-directed Rna polymerase II RPB3 [Cardiosporidium cionae]|uniref:Dna-directed Rna polymerase II RPB3 n=1 Tax=Cardiosporidium cionae TaxID=476202 RepID=A0ABQ7JBN3_9APIC|nr:Dna-directed Rna polymerase II RPB3 [Cardiosporidium cionae]|eukprot:KAF8821324.1 Dna-directed Rna polymerase II RPB3 [Cardiosporidium cionae]
MGWPSSKRPTIEVQSISLNRVEFILANVDISFANALRRIMLAEVPTLAIDLVTVYENTSIFHDEYLCHRLGLIPIDSRNVNEYNYRDECECMYQCPKCCIDFTLDVTCTTNGTLPVTHMDIYPDRNTEDIPLPVRLLDSTGQDQQIMIVKLRKDQKIKVKMTASKGIGKVHAKWIPVATAVYQMERLLRINPQVESNLSRKDKMAIVAALPPNTLKLEENNLGIGRLVVAENYDSSMFEVYENKIREIGYKDLLHIEEDESRFHFIVEGSGAIPVQRTVELALEVLDDKLSALQSHLSRIEKELQANSGVISMSRPLYNLD